MPSLEERCSGGAKAAPSITLAGRRAACTAERSLRESIFNEASSAALAVACCSPAVKSNTRGRACSSCAACCRRCSCWRHLTSSARGRSLLGSGWAASWRMPAAAAWQRRIAFSLRRNSVAAYMAAVSAEAAATGTTLPLAVRPPGAARSAAAPPARRPWASLSASSLFSASAVSRSSWRETSASSQVLACLASSASFSDSTRCNSSSLESRLAMRPSRRVRARWPSAMSFSWPAIVLLCLDISALCLSISSLSAQRLSSSSLMAAVLEWMAGTGSFQASTAAAATWLASCESSAMRVASAEMEAHARAQGEALPITSTSPSAGKAAARAEATSSAISSRGLASESRSDTALSTAATTLLTACRSAAHWLRHSP
mmetsp:Transcript_17030/g.66360  ORF Transcript_17030/g.66360 Transcript_17030/m.66360 type:complete len:374 (+) Transcript_17030:151-1272(+)